VSDRASLLPDAQERACLARRKHRTVTDVASERDGVAFEGGKRLTDTFQYQSRCMCGWVGPVVSTAGEASVTGVAHRGEKIAEACRG
jgi:hypothetical protein